MNAETTRQRLQRIADAALAGNRRLVQRELLAAMETGAAEPEVWLWQAWAAASPAAAVAALQQAESQGGERSLIAAGLQWFEGLQQLAAGQLLDEPAPHSVPSQSMPAPQPSAPQELEPEVALLNELSAIHDEVFAALEANPPHSLDDLQAMLTSSRRGPVVRRFRTAR